MAKLIDLLKKVNITSISGEKDLNIKKVRFDSRQKAKNSLFVAVKGTQVDGHKYIEQAIKTGSIAVVCEKIPVRAKDDITYVVVKDTALALGVIAANFYGNPSGKLTLVAVTGTNGKTTVVTLLYRLFKKLGYDVGMISTVENRIKNKVVPTTHTTPDPIKLNDLLQKMVKAGCTHCFMEASSHAIVQKRIAGLKYTGAVFTNITHDHLDYHKTFDNYIKAKKMIFDALPSSAFALVNLDDKRGPVMQQNTKGLKSSFSLKSNSEYKGKIITNTLEGLEMEIDDTNAWFKLIGDFNGYNLMAAYATAMLLGEENKEVIKILSELDPAPGRFEKIHVDSKITGIVDYAHTPDALKNVLTTLGSFRSGKENIITVIGCGGNRDKTKRPAMASIACELSDKVILTNDNPRDEDPDRIIKDMLDGISASDKKKSIVMKNREEAIKTACLMAAENDIILVAGKGHEKYQEEKGIKTPFDDKEVLSYMLKLFN